MILDLLLLQGMDNYSASRGRLISCPMATCLCELIMRPLEDDDGNQGLRHVSSCVGKIRVEVCDACTQYIFLLRRLLTEDESCLGSFISLVSNCIVYCSKLAVSGTTTASDNCSLLGPSIEQFAQDRSSF